VRLSELKAFIYELLEGALVKLECQSGLPTFLSMSNGVINVGVGDDVFELRISRQDTGV